MAEMWSIPFVGREEELALIQEHLQAVGTRRVIFIAGEGGIGKTRLLHEVAARFSLLPDKLSLKIPDIIDFDDDQYKFPGNVGFTLARQLDPVAFEPYFEASHDLHLAEEHYGDINTALVMRKALAVDRIFAENFNSVSAQQRVMLRVDTTDVIATDDTLSLKHLFDLVAPLKNVILLIAGRNAAAIYENLGKAWGNDALLITLQTFELTDSRTYLKHKQQALHVTLDAEWMDKLFILAGGLPVLIDLAIEWGQIRRPLKGMDSLSLNDLQALEQLAQAGNPEAKTRLENLREDFKAEVVMPTADLRSQLDHLKLVLAKIHPLDLEGIMEMLDINQEQAQQLQTRASESVAIKTLPDGRIKLHDEVQVLMNKFVWSKLDPQGEWEQHNSQRAVNYLTRKSRNLLEEIQRLKEREGRLTETNEPSAVMEIYNERREKEIQFWTLRIERLRRQLQNDVQLGYAMFQEDYQMTRDKAVSFHYRGSLLSTIDQFAKLEGPKTDLKGQSLAEPECRSIQEKIAREARHRGMYARAAEIYEKLLTQIPQDSEEYLSLLDGQANLYVRAGFLHKAQRLNEQALRLSQEKGLTNWETEFKIETGWVHRLMGQLDMAQKHYEDALRMAILHDDEMRIARIYNNLAYVHALKHQDRALDEIKRAIMMWQKLIKEQEGMRFRLGVSYNVAGEVCLELEKPEEALNYFGLSWNIFELEEAQHLSQECRALEWKSKSRSGRGFAYWELAQRALKKDDVQATQSHLEAARVDLEWAVKHAAPFDNPNILNRLGEVYFLLEAYPETIEVWLQSMDEARQTGDAFTELHSLSDLARVAFYHPIERFRTWQDLKNYYNRDYRQRHRGIFFEILHGLFHTYLGHLALQAAQLDDAKQLYEKGLCILAQTGTYGNFNLAGQLDFMEAKIFPEIPSATVRELGAALLDIWLTREQNITALSYFRDWGRWTDKV